MVELMDVSQTLLLRELLAETNLLERTREFGRALRVSTRSPGGLLLFGTPDQEPWHLTAHLDDEARRADVPELRPTLVRWLPPPGAPPHLAVGLDRLAAASRGESLLVVAENEPSTHLLERVDAVRRRGVNVFALDTGQPELTSIVHEVLSVDPADEPLVSFEAAQHLVSVAAGEAAPERRPRGMRAKLGRLLDVIADQ